LQTVTGNFQRNHLQRGEQQDGFAVTDFVSGFQPSLHRGNSLRQASTGRVRFFSMRHPIAYVREVPGATGRHDRLISRSRYRRRARLYWSISAAFTGFCPEKGNGKGQRGHC
jgi:hypothetical protein